MGFGDDSVAVRYKSGSDVLNATQLQSWEVVSMVLEGGGGYWYGGERDVLTCSIYKHVDFNAPHFCKMYHCPRRLSIATQRLFTPGKIRADPQNLTSVISCGRKRAKLLVWKEAAQPASASAFCMCLCVGSLCSRAWVCVYSRVRNSALGDTRGRR